MSRASMCASAESESLEATTTASEKNVENATDSNPNIDLITTTPETCLALVIASPDDDLPLTAEEERLARLYRKGGKAKQSWSPLLFFLAASFGKLILGFGAGLAVRGHYTERRTDFILGVVFAILGLLGCIAAALGFGAAVSSVSRIKGILIKTASISGAILIGLGYAMNNYIYYSPVQDTNRWAFIPLFIGTALMCISLPNFTAYTELRDGRVKFFPLEHRPTIALACFSPSIAVLCAGWVVGEHTTDWPVAFNVVMLTFFVALALVGVALNWSNALHARAHSLEQRLTRFEERQGVKEKQSA